MPPLAAPAGIPHPLPPCRRTLTIGSLFAGVAAAFAGTFMVLTFVYLWEAIAGSDEIGPGLMMIPVGAFFLSLFGFWLVLPLTLPVVLILGHLSPPLERLLSPADMCWVQYASWAGAGFSLLLALGLFLEVGEDVVPASLAGMLAGLAAARTFRRFCYGSW